MKRGHQLKIGSHRIGSTRVWVCKRTSERKRRVWMGFVLARPMPYANLDAIGAYVYVSILARNASEATRLITYVLNKFHFCIDEIESLSPIGHYPLYDRRRSLFVRARCTLRCRGSVLYSPFYTFANEDE